ncbi:energy-coupling factor ABC transporter substrate-binding protein [Clostridium perfringens]|uniref:energy-coupling factor ABC transporter substrate-binding protein n=1 Tax=Clostridium perfringens TaxID=1502 RepID=UPI0018E45A27|nr:energy-coupling factor ABC transporter substrate-binding protein [Clostridium perfringens]MBI5977928.1 energy-coupling factor ABC transporter substrate-binding protein [Clostridium perfringens]MBI5980622.1 energy-coupling factor ABC transporter substrate-binding protein [Clostridium perfringens]MDK0908029.1 energy-coupling factor ABC transporter substrate-binding protein [Clostridium perfringens]
MKNKRVLTNVILLLLVVFITIIPFFVAKNGEFGGSDDQAEEAITQIDENYEPWFSPLFEPASGEIESLLFALQATIGAGVIGFGLGYLKGKKKVNDEVNDKHR